MQNEAIIARLRNLEASARMLIEEAVKTRKELESIASPAPRKGRKPKLTREEQEIVARGYAKFQQRHFKKVI